MARLPQYRRVNPEIKLDGAVPAIPASAWDPHNSTFICFMQLPREIRDEIWRLSVDKPHVVEIGYFIASDGSEHYPSRTVVPALLHVCRQSREIGLRHFQPFMPVGVWTGSYVNWELDYIYPKWSITDFTTSRGMGWLSPADDRLTSQCKHILVDQATFKQTISVFAGTQDFALLRNVENEKQSQNSAQSFGGSIQLFDVHYDKDSPYASLTLKGRGSEWSSKKLAYLITPVVALVRKSAKVSAAVHLKSISLEKQIRQQFSPPVFQRTYCDEWSSQRLSDEFYDRELWEGDTEEEMADDYTDDVMRARIEVDIKERLLYDYDRQFRYRLLEMREEVRFGNGESVVGAVA